MKKMFMGMAALALAVVVSAQGGPPQGGFQGGPPQGGFGQRGPGGPGGPGQMRGGMMQGGPMLLMQPGVQKELKLTEDQKQKIEQLLRQGGPGGPGGPPQGGFGQGGPGQGGPPQGGFQGGPPQGQRQGGQGRQGQGGGFGQRGPGGPGGPGGPENDQRRQEMEGKIKGILNADQFARYQQLTLQAEGPRAFMRQDVAEKLNLSDDQRDQIQQILEQGRPQGGPGQGGPPQGGFGQRGQAGQGGQGGPPDFEKMRAEMEKRREETMLKVLGVLNGSQKNTWSNMVGKPFKFDPPQGPGGFGGPGGGQGRGGGGR